MITRAPMRFEHRLLYIALAARLAHNGGVSLQAEELDVRELDESDLLRASTNWFMGPN